MSRGLTVFLETPLNSTIIKKMSFNRQPRSLRFQNFNSSVSNILMVLFCYVVKTQGKFENVPKDEETMRACSHSTCTRAPDAETLSEIIYIYKYTLENQTEVDEQFRGGVLTNGHV